MFSAISPNGHDLTVDFPKQPNWTGLISEMEIVPSCHEGVFCNSCCMKPIRGPRFKCKVCESFDYCENCFYTKRNHRHSFNRINEPGEYFLIQYFNEEIIHVIFITRIC